MSEVMPSGDFFYRHILAPDGVTPIECDQATWTEWLKRNPSAGWVKEHVIGNYRVITAFHSLTIKRLDVKPLLWVVYVSYDIKHSGDSKEYHRLWEERSKRVDELYRKEDLAKLRKEYATREQALAAHEPLVRRVTKAVRLWETKRKRHRTLSIP